MEMNDMCKAEGPGEKAAESSPRCTDVAKSPPEVPGASPKIDPMYEFNAPQFHDFTRSDTDDDATTAESYFIKSGTFSESAQSAFRADIDGETSSTEPRREENLNCPEHLSKCSAESKLGGSASANDLPETNPHPQACGNPQTNEKSHNDANPHVNTHPETIAEHEANEHPDTDDHPDVDVHSEDVAHPDPEESPGSDEHSRDDEHSQHDGHPGDVRYPDTDDHPETEELSDADDYAPATEHPPAENITESRDRSETVRISAAQKPPHFAAPTKSRLKANAEAPRAPSYSLLASDTIAAAKTNLPTPQILRHKSNLHKPTASSQARLHFLKQVPPTSDKAGRVVRTERKPTRPQQPKLSQRSSHRPQAKSSEDLEIERIQKEMQDAARRRQQIHQKLYRVIGITGEANTARPAVRSTKQLTIPKPFNFTEATARTGRSTQVRPLHSSRSEENIRSSVRTKTAPKQIAPKQRQSRRTRPTTRPRPFRFASSSRSRSRARDSSQSRSRSSSRNGPSAAGDQNQPLTVRAREFFSKRSTEVEGTRLVSASALSLKSTVPHEFQLSTPRRSSNAISSEEREILEIQQHQPFKASKVNRKVLYSVGDVGVPRIHKKNTTVPKSFQLSTSRRAAPEPKEDGEFRVFRARPVPMSVQRPRSARQTPRRFKATMPVSPRLSKPRPKPTSGPQPQSEFSQFKARAVPDFSKTPSRRKIRTPTKPEPFHLQTEERGQRHRQEFEHRLNNQIKQEENDAMYKARPLIFTSPMPVENSHKELTEPIPFNFASSSFAEKHKQQFDRQVQDEFEKENKQFSSFRARVPIHLLKEPFVPAPSQKEPVHPEPFALQTSERAVKRLEFDAAVHQNMLQAEEARKQRELEKQRRAQQEDDEYFTEHQFKARPVPTARSVWKPTKKAVPLTDPRSPHFATTARLGQPNSRARRAQVS